MRVKKLGALLLALLLITSTVPAHAAESSVTEAAQAAIEAAAQYGSAVSVQYALWEDGAITATGSTGAYSKRENRALTEDIMYGVGSISKVYTTAAVMLLVEDGKVELDKPVTTYLPHFKMADERYKDITVRMLLNHSSGLMGSTMHNGFLLNDPDPVAKELLLSQLAAQRLKADPGAFSVYCNDGFTLAELLVERVSGQSFEDFLQHRIFDPNGLKSTYLPGGDFDASRLAKTYAAARPTTSLPNETLGVVGTGGIYANASDLATFGGLFCGTKLLTKKSVEQTTAPEYANGIWPEDAEDMISYGLGWDAVEFYPFAYSDIQAIVKGGDTLNYHAGLVVLPEYNMSVAVMSSGGVSTYNEMAGAQILVAALKARGVSVEQSTHAIPAAELAAMPAELTAYSGLYGTSTNVATVTVSADGELAMGAETYQYYSDGSFRNEDASVMVKFVEEENGQTYLWQKAYSSALEGLGEAPVSGYALMRMPENKVSAEVQQAWDARNGKMYLALNQKYTAAGYAVMMPLAGVATDAVNMPGYMYFDRLVDENYAEGVALIPGTGGRDWQNLTMSVKNGVEYLETSGLFSMDSAAVKPLYGGTGAYTTIQADGYARWYQVGSLANKTLSVVTPEQGAFYVYGADGLPVAGSWAWGDTSATLPEGGWIVFAGEPDAKFLLEVK